MAGASSAQVDRRAPASHLRDGPGVAGAPGLAVVRLVGGDGRIPLLLGALVDRLLVEVLAGLELLGQEPRRDVGHHVQVIPVLLVLAVDALELEDVAGVELLGRLVREGQREVTQGRVVGALGVVDVGRAGVGAVAAQARDGVPGHVLHEPDDLAGDLVRPHLRRESWGGVEQECIAHVPAIPCSAPLAQLTAGSKTSDCRRLASLLVLCAIVGPTQASPAGCGGRRARGSAR